MERISMKEVLIKVLCCGFVLTCCLCGTTLMAAEGLLQRQSANSLESGRIFYVGDETITIEDQGYAITTTTHYRTRGGGVTTKGYFRVGDKVEFLYNPVDMTIVELRIKEAASGKVSGKEKKREEGVLRFRNGVWTN